jgi:hypothetical protein
MTRGAVAFLAALLTLSACSIRPAGDQAAGEALPTSTRTPVPTATPDLSSEPTPASLTRTDDQGAVEFVVEPLNLNDSGDTLDFSVSMNTHSMDVGWDLAALATLETDAGVKVGATAWPIGSGHHYGGTLSFPRLAANGADLLDGASALRLTIRDTDVLERVFTWEISP